MVEGQTEFDREAWMLEELQLQDAHDEVLRLREEQEAPRKLKGKKKKKKKKTPSRLHRDEQRVAQRRAEAEKLVARLEAKRAERAGKERETEWRGVAQDDLKDSDGELCFEDPRQATWARLPQDMREVPEDKAVLALRSLVRAAAEATAEAAEAAATTSGARLAKKQSKVFDPGGGM
jgi:hypothetical protein